MFKLLSYGSGRYPKQVKAKKKNNERYNKRPTLAMRNSLHARTLHKDRSVAGATGNCSNVSGTRKMREDTVTTKVYPFDELSDAAKETAIEKLWDINGDYEWWASTCEDAKTIGLAIIAFEVKINTLALITVK